MSKNNHKVDQLLFCDDVIDTILSFCHPNKIISFSLISKQFHQVITPKITSLEFSKHDKAIHFLKSTNSQFVITKLKISLGWESLQMIELFKNKKSENLTFLDLRNNQLKEKQIEDLASCINLKNLRHLDLGYNSFTRNGLMAIVTSPNLQKLTHLSVSGNGINRDFDFSLLNQYLPELKSLDLSANHFSEQDISPIFTLSLLTWLNLRELPGVNWERLDIVPQFESLTYLNVGRNRQVSSFILQKLMLMENCLSLKGLDLGYINLTLDEIKEVMRKFVNLRKLNLYGIRGISIESNLEDFAKINDKIKVFSYFSKFDSYWRWSISDVGCIFWD